MPAVITVKKLTIQHKRIISYLCGACFILLFTIVGVKLLVSSHAATPNGPITPPAEICGDTTTLNGPTTAPAGAVTVPAGDDSSVTFNTPNTVYWFAAGTHTLGTGQYGQIDPGQGDTYTGAPGAIISGQGENDYAFVASYQAPFATDVTIEHLTIEDFTPPASQGAVNQNSGSDWTFEYDTVQNNSPGAGLFLGSGDVATYNCLTQNGQYGFQEYSGTQTDPLTGGPANVTLNDNEISYNDTCNLEGVSPNPVPVGSRPSNCGAVSTDNGCGCTGGGKFWEVNGSTIDNNYVHNNYSTGLWADTNNNGLTFEGNYISDNYSIGLQYEVSYNAVIENNTFLDNAWGGGAANPGFPEGAIYISESGGDSRVSNTAGIKTITISNNTFTDNWSGVILWENANRFCSNGLPTTECTLVDPSVATVSACQSALANSSENKPTDTPDYFDLCRWKTQNVSVSNNVFNLTSANIGTNCTLSNKCGLNGVFSLYGSTGPYTSSAVPTNIAFNQNNIFSDNTYNGPWGFMAWSQGNEDFPITWAQWTAAVTDKCSTSGEISSGTCNSGFGQDMGSTYDGTAPTSPTLPSTPASVSAIATSASSVTVSWNASLDSGGPGLGGYYILRNGTQIGSVGASSTSYIDSTVSAGTNYNYTVEAYDTTNPPDISAASAVATVTTPANAQAPTVAVTTPATGALIHGNAVVVDATATPSSGNTISQVQLLVNGTVVQSISNAPYDFMLNSLNYGDGTNLVTLRATDNHGNIGTESTTITITNGDLTGANKIGVADLSILAAHWGQTDPNYTDGNITGQSTINISDLSVLASNWGDTW